MNFVELEDPAIWSSIAAEQTRQAEGLEMIASENFTSPAVMQAVGSVLTNKYAEGYPGRRYYGGCEYVDTVEDLAREERVLAAALAGVDAALDDDPREPDAVVRALDAVATLRAAPANPAFTSAYPLLAELDPFVALPLLGNCSARRSCAPE